MTFATGRATNHGLAAADRREPPPRHQHDGHRRVQGPHAGERKDAEQRGDAAHSQLPRGGRQRNVSQWSAGSCTMRRMHRLLAIAAAAVALLGWTTSNAHAATAPVAVTT